MATEKQVVPVLDSSPTKYARHRVGETPSEKLILSSQFVLDGQPNNKGMSPNSLWKPDRMFPVYNWHSKSKMIPCGAHSECPGRIKRPRNGVLLIDIKMIIRTTILDGHKVS